MTTLLVCILPAAVFGGTAWYRSLMAGIAVVVCLAAAIVLFLVFGWWFALAAACGIGGAIIENWRVNRFVRSLPSCPSPKRPPCRPRRAP